MLAMATGWSGGLPLVVMLTGMSILAMAVLIAVAGRTLVPVAR